MSPTLPLMLLLIIVAHTCGSSHCRPWCVGRQFCAPANRSTCFARKTATPSAVETSDLPTHAWFLNELELRASRSGRERRNMKLFTKGNHVEPLLSGEEMFHALLDDMLKMRRGDAMHWLGWCADDVLLNRHQGLSLTQLLRQMVSNGVYVRAMLFQSPVIVRGNGSSEMVAFINGMSNGKARAILYNRMTRTQLGAHHEKVIVLVRNASSSSVAFVGGIDLCAGRDDAQGWIDESQRMSGPCVDDVHAHFVQRWTTNPAFKWTRSLIDESWAIPKVQQQQIIGSKAVQIVRTMPCRSSSSDHGEFSLLQSRLKAIRTARRYIFFIEHFFVHVEVMQNALLEALKRIQRLVIVVGHLKTRFKWIGYGRLRLQMVRKLKLAWPHKVLLLTPRNRRLYVHSKTLIVDDMFVSIGSANVNNRGMTADTEVAANVLDARMIVSADGVRVGEHAFELRVTKFAEMAAVTKEEMGALAFLDACDLLERRAEEGTALVMRLDMDWTRAPMLRMLKKWQAIVDPIATCHGTNLEPVAYCRDAQWLERQNEVVLDLCASVLKSDG